MKNRKYWTEKRIISQILSLKEKGSPLHYSYIETYHKNLAEAGRRVFGTWNDALSTAGINMEKIYDSGKESRNRNRISVLQQYPDLKKIIGNNVKKRREELGLLQVHVVERTGIRTKNLGRLESGRSIPQLTTLIILAEALNVDLNYFLKGTGLFEQTGR